MKLADLQLAMELQAALTRLDDIAGPASLIHGNETINLSADELAAFVAWRRAALHRQLRALGVEPDGAAAEILTGPFPAEVSRHLNRPEVAAEHIAGTIANATRPTSRAEAEDLAVRQVMGSVYDDWQNGALDDPAAPNPQAEGDRKFAELKQRRRGLIDQAVAELLRGDRAELCHCGEAATTTIAGAPLCAAHAAAAPRPERPGFLRRMTG